MSVEVTTPVVATRSISILVPVFNEENSIKRFVQRIDEEFSALPVRVHHHIIFVNDGSTDATEIMIQSLAAQTDTVRYINLSRNFGKEAALAAAIDHAPGDAVIPMDVDLQDPPELLPEMIRLWLDGAKIVNARRVSRAEDSWTKRKSAGAFYRLFNAVAEHPIPRDVGDFRLLDREVVEVIRKLGERARFNKALFSWVGFEAREVTFERPSRGIGESRWSYWKLWKLALDGIFTSSTAPLRVWTYLGFILAALSLVYAGFIFISTVFGGRDTPGYASTVILILAFGALNMTALGILGEYIGRIYLEVRQRPLYVIRSASSPEWMTTDGS